MNVHLACFDTHETDPPPFTSTGPFTATEFARLEETFDYPEFIIKALEGDRESQNYVSAELKQLANGIPFNDNAKKTIELLARYGFEEAIALLGNF